MPDKIRINESYIKDRIRNFTDYDNESSDRLGNFPWGSTVNANLNAEVDLRPGAEGFTPGKELFTNADAVRANFADRMLQFNEQSAFLWNGLTSLLETQDEVQSLNNMTADEFGSYVDEVASGATPPTGGGKAA